MIGLPPSGTSPSWPVPSPDEAQWAATMLLVAQAIQRLHTAFDAKFIHPKNVP